MIQCLATSPSVSSEDDVSEPVTGATATDEAGADGSNANVEALYTALQNDLGFELEIATNYTTMREAWCYHPESNSVLRWSPNCVGPVSGRCQGSRWWIFCVCGECHGTSPSGASSDVQATHEL